MAAGLVDIVSYGSQDLFLTGTPQITFFKVVYRRYTNFAIESFEIPFDDHTGFGVTSNVILKHIGDLIHKMYLKIKIPKISFIRSIAPDIIRNSSQRVIKAYNEYQRSLIFMNVNSNAYRAAMEIYSASNIFFSEEMVDVILKVFGSYSIPTQDNACNYKCTGAGINDVSNIVDNINWFYVNSPINYIDPSKFNLLIIAQNFQKFLGTSDPNYDPSVITKDNFKLMLDRGMSYCQNIQLYYDQLLNNEIGSNLDITNPNFKFAWVDRLGHAIVDYIDVYIGGDRIDRQYGIWINIWYELCGKKEQNDIYMKMIGHVPELINFNRTEKPEYILYVPLQFWFNRFNGLSIPLVAFQYDDVTITIKLRKFKECAYIENRSGYTNTNNFAENINLDNLLIDDLDPTGYKRNLDAYLLVDYVYLDSLERKRFAQSSHEYLIDQVQVLKIDGIDNELTRVNLDFNHPCKEIIWILQKGALINNGNGFVKSRWDNYTPNKNNKGFSTIYASLDFNGYSRFDKFGGTYFNYLQPYQHHKNIPSDGVNVYSFALQPEEQQPTGSCNFTRITKAILNLWINRRMFYYSESDTTDENGRDPPGREIFTELILWIFAINHNILRVISGMAALAYI